MRPDEVATKLDLEQLADIGNIKKSDLHDAITHNKSINEAAQKLIKTGKQKHAMDVLDKTKMAMIGELDDEKPEGYGDGFYE